MYTQPNHVSTIAKTLIIIIVSNLINLFRADFIVKEAMMKGSYLKLISTSPLDHIHEVLIAVKQNNLDKIQAKLMERSKPGSALYQRWLTFDEVGVLTQNKVAFSSIMSWLNQSDVIISWISNRRDYIRASATIQTWNQLLNTKFQYWNDSRKSDENRYIHRAESYSVPLHLNQHIAAIFSTTQLFPSIVHNSHQKQLDAAMTSTRIKKGPKWDTQSSSLVTVSFLNNLYGITSNLASSSLGQAVFETNDENFEQSDLTQFQKTYGLTQQAALVQGTTATTSGCTTSTCGEGSLDIQYIMGVAQVAPSTFWYVPSSGDPFITFLMQVADSSDPPTTLSISWGAYEDQVSSSYLTQFNSEAMKLGSMGVTIFASSGDDGVSGSKCQCTIDSSSSQSQWSGSNAWEGVGYFPQYPASSPYVVAVGATMGPETGKPEVTCESDKGGVITSGGGFSTFYSRPDYQSTAVEAYLSSSTGKAAALGYNSAGRGYPDLSFIGVNYPVVVNGDTYSFYGTSASAPVAAALISLVNAHRKSAGLGTVGFINPTLYSNAGKFTNISSGKNNCCAQSKGTSSPKCCNAGFSCVPGWDPVNGLGSITYSNLISMLSTNPPTVVPSRMPINNTTSTSNKSGLTKGAVAAITVVFLILGIAGTAFVGFKYYRYNLSRGEQMNKTAAKTGSDGRIDYQPPTISPLAMTRKIENNNDSTTPRATVVY